ncbi:hypothetical protein ACU635_30715 [[Actinomadura] parvosata]|uniref:hypothetical protein n=1 Tax=[Actinomadura] parvosata TaxID=1955412 RepID=UPI00406CFF95
MLIVLIALAGLPGAAVMAGLTTFARTAADVGRLGAVFGLVMSAQAATSLLGMALAGVLGERFGIVPTRRLHAAGLMAAGPLVVVTADGRRPPTPEAPGTAPGSGPGGLRAVRR